MSNYSLVALKNNERVNDNYFYGIAESKSFDFNKGYYYISKTILHHFELCWIKILTISSSVKMFKDVFF